MSSRPTLTIAGAGMAGLVAAVRARQLGMSVDVHEKGDRVGGSMLLSSGVIWRYRSAGEFGRQCPRGNPELQRLLIDRLDDDLDWLERLGAEPIVRKTGNPLTVGRRFDPRRLTEVLAAAVGDVPLASPVPVDAAPLVLATGGFGGALARRRRLALRANPWSVGDGLEMAAARGAATIGDGDEFYGRLLPDALVPEELFVPAAQLYARLAALLDAGGGELAVDLSWSEVEAPQVLSAAGGRGWLVVDAAVLSAPAGNLTVAERIAVAERLEAEVRRAPSVDALGLGSFASPRLRRPPFTAVSVVAGVTHTLSGLLVDPSARVLRPDGTSIDGLYAAGVDAGGIGSGGYASGLAAALVLGKLAAETARADL